MDLQCFDYQKKPWNTIRLRFNYLHAITHEKKAYILVHQHAEIPGAAQCYQYVQQSVAN